MAGLNLNDLKAEHNRLKDEGQRGDFLKNFVKMPEGKGSVTVRLLPPAKAGMFGRDDNPFYQWTRIHRVNGKSLHDPRVMIDGRWVGENPIGEYLRWLWKESEEKDADEQMKMRAWSRAIKPIERYYYNVIVREEADENGVTQKNVGPKILSIGKTLHQIILKGICGDEELGEEGYGDVTDLKAGRDFKIMKTIRRSGDETYPNYDQSRFLDASPCGSPDEVEVWLAELHDLAALRVLKTPEELDHELKVHLGVKQDTDTNFDPTEYQKKPDSIPVVDVETEDEQTEEVAVGQAEAEQGSEETVEEPTETDATQELAADDFLSKIKNLPTD
jgi:hypothetical protein